ncbi:unnamed protein product [Pseudo-nitzschia multistriata]|uniref:Uncharacterized protein n=1 Tax=Pseudo-nitzschia multistriata TaxID=183589 RepID=A0A448Z2H3_9STRA|nr:unnamed protein product [Pseudo-nitzschia multistriata]
MNVVEAGSPLRPLVLEAVGNRPQPQRRVPDEEELAAAAAAAPPVPREVLWVRARAVGDTEPALAAPVDQVGDGAQVLCQLPVPPDPRRSRFVAVAVVSRVQAVHDLLRPDVPVLPDQPVDRLVLPEPLDPRRQNDQLPAVGDRHPRPVDGLVAEPGRVKLVRIEVDDHLGRRPIQHGEIGGHAQLAGPPIALDGVPDKDPPEAPVWGHHRQNVPQVQLGLQKVLAGPVQYGPQGVVGPAHHVLHPVDGADEVGEVDRLQAAHPHEEVLVEVGHAHDLVRDDLPDRNDQGRWCLLFAPPVERETLLPDGPVQLRRPRPVDHPVGGLPDHRSRDVPDGHHVLPPVVHQKGTAALCVREARELRAVHGLDLFAGHGGVGPQRRHNLELLRRREPRGGRSGRSGGRRYAPVVPRDHLRDFPRLGMEPREIRGEQKDVVPLPQLVQKGVQSLAQPVVADPVGAGRVGKDFARQRVESRGVFCGVCAGHRGCVVVVVFVLVVGFVNC